MHWSRKWQPTPVFLPGDSQGWGSLVGCRLWGHVKAICLVLGALGIANMWLAVFADVGVMILAVLNAIRALFVSRL